MIKKKKFYAFMQFNIKNKNKKRLFDTLLKSQFLIFIILNHNFPFIFNKILNYTF